MGYGRIVACLVAVLALLACGCTGEEASGRALVAFLDEGDRDWPVLVAGQELVLFRPGTLEPALRQALPAPAGALAVRDGRLVVGDARGTVAALVFAFPLDAQRVARPVFRERGVLAETGAPVRFLGWAGPALAVGLADGRLVFPGGEKPPQSLEGARAFSVSGSHAVLSSAARSRIVSFLDPQATGEVTNLAASVLDADRLYFVGHEGGISVRELGGIERRDIDRGLVTAGKMFLSRDGRWLAVLGADRQHPANGLAAFYGLQDGRILMASYPGQRLGDAAFDRSAGQVLLVVGRELLLVAFGDPNQKVLGTYPISN